MFGKYIVIDGMDGAGKGTQLKLLQDTLGDRAIFIREPGGTPFAEKIRTLVRDDPLAGKSTPLNNFLLFWAAREELQENLVAGAIQGGRHVISDRGDSSTFAFQLHGEMCQELIGVFTALRKLVFSDVYGRREPDLYLILDLPPEIARQRALADAAREKNHFDDRGLDYYDRVRQGFKRFATRYPQTAIINAEGSVEEVQRRIRDVLSRRIALPTTNTA